MRKSVDQRALGAASVPFLLPAGPKRTAKEVVDPVMNCVRECFTNQGGEKRENVQISVRWFT
jgi:hypothetical protein